MRGMETGYVASFVGSAKRAVQPFSVPSSSEISAAYRSDFTTEQKTATGWKECAQ